MSPGTSRKAVAPAPQRARWPRWLALLGLAGLLFLMGECDEAIYAGLARGWHGALAVVGRADWAAAGSTPGLSQHGWPVAMSYRLLYFGLNVLTLHVLLRGRGTRAITAGYGAALVLCLALVLGGYAAHLPWLASQGHLLLGIVCSPLALMLIYGSAALGQ
ncbi:XrtX-associated membrane protein [Hymenobacter caeli]|uniref:DUF998 domain-containing protein n=1 Tax=Hymenobacter caeli TaxID=2735894 RepID=A0ABX2FSE9_9BACT|nr:hypothetical protein [Hymenobacter caeli]NRT19389.1 hypothetical protein [Hymenobacter caeli]